MRPHHHRRSWLVSFQCRCLAADLTKRLLKLPSRSNARGLLASGICVLLALIVPCAAGLPAWQADLAQAPSPSEFEVKATYLYNFGKFVEWPQPALAQGDAFAICVLGRDPFGPILDTALAGQTLKGRPAVARRIASVQDAAGCRILFIGASERAQLAHLLAAISGMPVLTVSDIEGFAARGGMVQLVLDDFRVRFELNVASAASAGLTFSAQLLYVAKSVRGAPSGI